MHKILTSIIVMLKYRYFLFLLISVFLFSCGQDKVYKIGVSQCSDDDWRQKMNSEIHRELMFHPEATVEILSADDSSEKQINDIRYFINNDFDVIIAAPNEAEALTPIISEAYKRGIPVVLFDRNINGEDFTAWQGADNRSIGKAAAQYVVSKVGPNAKTIEICGFPGSSPAEERHLGFNEVDGINVVGTAYGNWNYEDASRVTDSLIEMNPDAEVIFAHNDRMAIAASNIAKKHNINPLIVGIDAAPEIGLKAVANGEIDVTFLYPTEGQRLVRTALAILNGEPYEKYIYLPATPPVDSSNVDILIFQNETLNDETTKMEQLKVEMEDYWSEHSSQTAFLYASVVIVIRLFGLLFMLLSAFWQHKRHQKTLLKQNRLLQEERDKQKLLNNQLDAATSSKLAFFTNVSHDLRTPLTLIYEPIERISDSENIDEREKALMKIARKNVHILHRLINQILDFRKYESEKLQLNLSEVNFAAHIEEWSSAFVALAQRKNIKFDFSSEIPENATMAVDIEKMERVFYNILSNAFKYTPEGGVIGVTLKNEADKLVLIIKDSGIGIPAKDLPLIFNRFFQADHIHPSGSGIGLALAKAFVELHGGVIDVESEAGKGTTFIIILPVGHVGNTSAEAKTVITPEFVDIEHSEFIHNNDVAVTPEQPLILVIDDNPDICALLSELLSDKYVIITAQNGEEGIRLAKKYVPDLIVCDVMMPGMDGMEVCKILKNDISTSHIPVLMLTACAMDEQRVESYEVGADGYLSKPFNTNVLMARIKNLIDNRQQILNLMKFEKNDEVPENQKDTPDYVNDSQPPVSQPGLSSIESEFFKKFLKIFEENMSNPDLNVETISSIMGLGYSQLYRKIKSLTNYRPVELIRMLRLEKARELMNNSEKTISEISYEVGFSNPAYFTKCYRDLYGETPTDTRSAPI